MTFMRWTEKMSVGVQEIDDDHKELIRIINRLAADADAEERRNAVRQSLIALHRYAEFHFAREEKVMAACGYPGQEEHKKEHRYFVDQIGELTQRFDQGPEQAARVVNEALLTFLQDWLSHHILIEDMAYRPYAEGSPEAREAAKSFKAVEMWWSG
jgi:hemerythrin